MSPALPRRRRARAASTAETEVARGAMAPDDVLLAMPAAFGPAMIALWSSCSLVGLAWYLSADQGLWFFAGSIASLIVSVPFVIGRYETLSPWSLVVVSVYLSCGVRGLAISAGVEGTRSIDQLFLRGHEVSYFVRPTVLFLCGLALLTLGYVIAKPTRRRLRRPFIGGAPHLSPSRVPIAIIGCALLGFIGFLLFAESTGGISLARISAKRTVINGVNLSTDYQSHGQYRVLNQFAPIALWLQVAYFNYRKVPHGIFSVRGLWLAVLFINAALLPVFASSRADVVYILIGALLVEYCLGGQKVRFRPLIIAGALILVLSAAISSLRYSDDASVTGVSVDSAELIDTFVLTRTFADIPTTGNIIQAVPERLPYAGGKTITAWLVAPIPRAVWPSKPIISSGPILGSVVYGNSHSGVPPGMMAESYWNFGLPGIFLIPFFCGILVRRFSEYWRPFAKTSPAAAIVMATVAVHPGIDMMTNSIGSAPYQVLVSLVLMVPVLAFVSSEHGQGPIAQPEAGTQAHAFRRSRQRAVAGANR